MDAKRIYSIVKDVPREAWPEGIDYWEVTGRPHFHDRTNETHGITHSPISDRRAETLFVGSMVAHLAKKSGCNIRTHDGQSFVFSRRPPFASGSAPTLIEALAAKCIEAAKGAGK